MGDSFAKFLNLLDCYPGPDFTYLNKQGVIPAGAVMTNEKDAPKVEAEEDDETVANADDG